MSTEDLAKWGVTSFDMNKAGSLIEKIGNGGNILDAFVSIYGTELIPILNDLSRSPINYTNLINHGIDLVQKGFGYTGTVAELQDAAAYAMSLVADNNPTRPEMTYNGYVDYHVLR